MHYAILLFSGFEALDAFGPLEVLNVLAEHKKIQLSVLTETRDPVSTRSPDPLSHVLGSTCTQEIVPTGTFADFLTADNQAATSPKEGSKVQKPIDVLIVPGGAGTRFPHVIGPVIDFVRAIYPSVQYALSICNGAGVFARAGILDGKRATTNKILWENTTALRPEVHWVREARWVVDGNVWTASGVSAGIDATLAFVRDVYGGDLANALAREMEYVWDGGDGTRDPFA
ncbi:class I glutamine amidotransferase-like protein [Aspergillus pseudoustus]|uniref:Class I glutamine amidotransferase-like protein n=1 Tax=Aspergillus pseudoustus TaxID=1810923 RepID=A0ABR4IKV8_9EURO